MERIGCLAAAQTLPSAGDVAANVRQHLQLVELAATEGVKLLVFPELSLTGYELASGPALAFGPHDARLQPLLAAARLHDMTLVVGAPLRSDLGLHIGALIIEPSGAIHTYTKHHLGAFRAEDRPDGLVPPPEDTYFVPGTSNPLLRWQGHTLALSICADSAYPSHAQLAAERGATIYASCQFAIPAHMAFKMSRLKDAARRHGLAIIFANYGGASGGVASAGASCVRSASGEAVVRLPATGSGLAIAWQEGSRWAGQAVLAEPATESL